ncbi:hypothetical protein ACRALDRAFT_2097686 [Sodiomyces alcalophilus JCM 7366]|uniref:uncharacterized protein n=1 Tax=Sodiomyces alcalophilus JCM 7366 TaxID=591952 RepID=UPI0039B4CA89
MADWGNNDWGAPAPAPAEWGPSTGADNLSNSGNAGEFDNGFGDDGGAGMPDDRGCFSCGKPGHMKSECPDAAAMTCRGCGKEGHMRRECPDAEPMVCNVCGEQGHMRRECPNKPAQLCRNCGEEGHTAAGCTNPRKIDRSDVPDMDAEKAWELMRIAAREKEIHDFKEALGMYLKHYPDMTYVELEAALRGQGINVWCIATERHHLPTMTNMDLQGNMDKKWAVSFRFHEKPDRPRDQAIWPKDAQENMARLADAGEPTARLVPRCMNCKEMGHVSKHCPEEKVTTNRVVIMCFNCDQEGHRMRDCPNPRKDKDKNTCRNCGESGHKAADCTEPRRMKCRNCDEFDHMAKDCPKPEDCEYFPSLHQARFWKIAADIISLFPRQVSRIKCSNCGEMGHKKSRCPNPAVQSEFDGDGGFDSNEPAAADGAGNTGGGDDSGWGNPSQDFSGGGQSDAW